MAERDGDGWIHCICGHRHWGRHGAAGLVLGHRAGAQIEILLQLRAAWTHQGSSWGVPGGARDSHENVVNAALREAQEEVGTVDGEITVRDTLTGVDHLIWSYAYVLGRSDTRLAVSACTEETVEARWVPLDEVARLPLHPGLREAWPRLQPWIITGL